MELIGKDGGEAAHEMHGEEGAMVGQHVSRKETAEMAYQKFVDGGIMAIGRKEIGEAGQITVGGGLTIDVGNDIIQRKAIAGMEGDNDVGRQLLLEDVGQEVSAQDGTAAFIAQDIAHAGGLLHETLAIIERTAAARA